MATEYKVRREIDAPVQVVWDLLSNAETWSDWNPTVISIKGPIAMGEKVELVSTLNPKRTFKLKVVEMSAPSHMVWSDGMPFGLFTGARTYSIEPNGTGSVFNMVESYTGPLAGLITKSIPDMTESFEEFANGLKAGAEGVG